MSIPHKPGLRNPRHQSPPMIALNPKTTALVLIDLQNGVLGRELAPISADELVARGKVLAEKFRVAHAAVVVVNAVPKPDWPDLQGAEPTPVPKNLPASLPDFAPGPL